MSNINIPTQVSPFSNFAQFPTVGKIRVIYIDKAKNTAYYWNDTTTTYASLGGASSVDWGSIGGDILDQTDLQNALSGKVDKVTGKGLSTNDYTTTEKNKLAGIQAGAEVNVNADWNATSGDAQILNKPTIPNVSGLATVVYVDAQDALKMDQSVYDPTESGRVNTARWVEIDVINNTGSSIPKMAVVYFNTSSSSADTPEIILANANSEATSSKTMGLTKDVIANGATGKVILEGEYNLFNTSAYSVGARLWLSTTAGQITTTAPTPPNHAVFLGIVSRSQTTNGRICIKIQNGYELDELHDVTATDYSNPQDVDSLLIRDNATSLWKRLTWANLKATAKTYFDTIYQAVLISGTNIKTINGNSVLGSGDLTISGGGGGSGIHLRMPQGYKYTNHQINLFWNGSSTQAQNSTAGQIRFVPFYPTNEFICNKFDIGVTTGVAGATFRFVIYSDNSGVPLNKLYESANIDASTVATKNIITNFTFSAGTVYWLAIHSSANSIGFAGCSQLSLYPLYVNGGTIYNGILSGAYAYASGSPATIVPATALFFGSSGAIQVTMWKQ
jgi:hypothetical protein